MPLTLDNVSVTMSSLSKEFVKVRVSGRRAGSVIDPTVYTVEFAFTTASVPATEPEAADWVSGSWETDTSQEEHYYARCLIGPSGTVELDDGDYDVWLRLDDTLEQPVRHVGRIIIT